MVVTTTWLLNFVLRSRLKALVGEKDLTMGKTKHGGSSSNPGMLGTCRINPYIKCPPFPLEGRGEVLGLSGGHLYCMRVTYSALSNCSLTGHHPRIPVLFVGGGGGVFTGLL